MGIGVAPQLVTASHVAINVLAGTITSSPFDISEAFKDRESASRPFATPIQLRAAVIFANLVSNLDNLGPSTYPLERDKCLAAASISSWVLDCAASKSKK